METTVTVDDISHVGLFEGLGRHALDEIAEKAVKTYVRPHMVLAKQGEQGFGFAIILSGNANVFVDGEIVASLGAGDVFGEVSLATGSRRNADVVSGSQMTLAHLMVWEFRSLVEKHPEVKERIDELVAQRSAGK